MIILNYSGKKVIGMSQQLDVEEPRLSRRRKIPRLHDDGHAEPDFPTTPEEHYRGIYYEALDLLIQGIEDRFNQSGYHIILLSGKIASQSD